MPTKREMKKEKSCIPHNSPNCENCERGGIEEPTPIEKEKFCTSENCDCRESYCECKGGYWKCHAHD